MESWKKVWRDGFAPQLSNEGLEALRTALMVDDPRLIQRATTSPPPLQYVMDWPCEAACPIGFCGWEGDGFLTVADVEEEFARLCFQADEVLGEPAACRYFLSWADETPRDEMRRELLSEVNLILNERSQANGVETAKSA